MDNEKQKQEVIDFLENTYTGAKMMRDEEVMLRASRALLAFKADVHKDIFIEENVLEFYYQREDLRILFFLSKNTYRL